LAGAVTVVKEIFGQGVVHGNNGITKHPVFGHGPQADNPGGGLLGSAENLRQQFLAFGMGGENQIRPVIHGEVGLEVQGLVDVAVIGVPILPLNGEGGDAFVFGEIRGHIILGAQGIGGAQTEARTPRP
jgi:hypothetical protein